MLKTFHGTCGGDLDSRWWTASALTEATARPFTSSYRQCVPSAHAVMFDSSCLKTDLTCEGPLFSVVKLDLTGRPSSHGGTHVCVGSSTTECATPDRRHPQTERFDVGTTRHECVKSNNKGHASITQPSCIVCRERHVTNTATMIENGQLRLAS